MRNLLVAISIFFVTTSQAQIMLPAYQAIQYRRNSLPIVTTTVISSITANSASSGGNISSDGGSSVTVRGVCWSTSSGPTIALATKTADGIGTGIFSSNITGLISNTTYYLRAYATNNIGTSYGNEVIFNTSPSTFILSGGVESTLGTETILKFLSNGTLTVTGSGTIRMLIGGGGGGGKSGKSNNGNTGGGGGEVIEQYLTVNPGTYNVIIGLGGTANGGNGGNSTALSKTARGGKGNGTSGNGYLPGAAGISFVTNEIWISGSGAGSGGNGYQGGVYTSGGDGLQSDIEGTMKSYGFGGIGGPYTASLPCCAPAGDTGYIDCNIPYSAVNAPPDHLYFPSIGGAGGGNTTSLTALADAGGRGILIIRYTKIP